MITIADLEVRHNNTKESVLVYKGSDVFTLHSSIGNFAVLLDPRMNNLLSRNLEYPQCRTLLVKNDNTSKK